MVIQEIGLQFWLGGKMTKFWHKDLSNIGDCEIGEGCTIHSHVWISDGVKIGSNTRIQAFTFIPKGVTIGDNCFIGPHVCFVHDRYPPSPPEEWEDIVVKDGAVIGGNATILCGVEIGKGAVIGAGSVVTKSVPKGETWYGNPARKA